MSVTTRRKVGQKVLPFILGLLGITGIYFGTHNYHIRAIGAIIIMIAAQLLRNSQAPDGSSVSPLPSNEMDLLTHERPRRLPWIVTILLILLVSTALFLLQIVALKGGHQGWTLIAVVGFIGFLTWINLNFSRLFQDFQVRAGSRFAQASNSKVPRANGPGRMLWTVSLALLPLFAASLLLLHIDAGNGARQAWPVDVFAAIAFVSFFVWFRLVFKIWQVKNREVESDYAIMETRPEHRDGK